MRSHSTSNRTFTRKLVQCDLPSLTRSRSYELAPFKIPERYVPQLTFTHYITIRNHTFIRMGRYTETHIPLPIESEHPQRYRVKPVGIDSKTYYVSPNCSSERRGELLHNATRADPPRLGLRRELRTPIHLRAIRPPQPIPRPSAPPVSQEHQEPSYRAQYLQG